MIILLLSLKRREKQNLTFYRQKRVFILCVSCKCVSSIAYINRNRTTLLEKEVVDVNCGIGRLNRFPVL